MTGPPYEYECSNRNNQEETIEEWLAWADLQAARRDFNRRAHQQEREKLNNSEEVKDR